MRRCCAELMAGPAGAELYNTGTRQRVGGGACSLGIRHKVSTGVQHQGYTNVTTSQLCATVSLILSAQTCAALQKSRQLRPVPEGTLNDGPFDCLINDGRQERDKEKRLRMWKVQDRKEC
jgi:hypothetical protein